jgi:hypothetical protein
MSVVSFVLVLGAVAAVASAAEKVVEKVALDKVPLVVMDAAKKAVPGIEVKHATKETMNDVVSFKLAGMANGKDAMVIVSADGKVQDTQMGIEVKDVPAPVSDAAMKAVMGLTIEKAMKGLQGEMSYFVLKGKVKDMAAEIKVMADGIVITVEQAVNVKDVPGAVTDAAMKAVKGFMAEQTMTLTEGKMTSYELKGKAEGMKYELKVSSDGKMVDVTKYSMMKDEKKKGEKATM